MNENEDTADMQRMFLFPNPMTTEQIILAVNDGDLDIDVELIVFGVTAEEVYERKPYIDNFFISHGEFLSYRLFKN